MNFILKDLSSPPQIIVHYKEGTEIEIMNDGGFIQLEKSHIVFNYIDGEVRDGETNRVYGKRGDAVAILAYQWLESIGDYVVWLRSSVRPAVALRDYSVSQLPDSHQSGCFWEVPAGMVEENEVGLDGLKAAAVREGIEEIGFTIPVENLSFLGKRVFICVGFYAERIFFLSAEVNWKERAEPKGDGSPYEHGGEVVAVPLKSALSAIDEGYLPDGKTQLAIYRLDGKLNK